MNKNSRRYADAYNNASKPHVFSLVSNFAPMKKCTLTW